MPTCVVAIHCKMLPEGPRWRAFAVECEQHGAWRADSLDADMDAARMDGHQCPDRLHEGQHGRLIPRDAMRTKSQALYRPETALRYLER